MQFISETMHKAFISHACDLWCSTAAMIRTRPKDMVLPNKSIWKRKVVSISPHLIFFHPPSLWQTLRGIHFSLTQLEHSYGWRILAAEFYNDISVCHRPLSCLYVLCCWVKMPLKACLHDGLQNIIYFTEYRGIIISEWRNIMKEQSLNHRMHLVQ